MGGVFFKVYVAALGVVVLMVAMDASAHTDPLDALIAALIIFGPWLGGAILGWIWGENARGLAAAVGLGFVVTAMTLAAFLFVAGSSEESACGEDECLHYLGHWIEASLAVQWPVYAATAWTFSVAVFARRRHGREATSKATTC